VHVQLLWDLHHSEERSGGLQQSGAPVSERMEYKGQDSSVTLYLTSEALLQVASTPFERRLYRRVRVHYRSISWSLSWI